MAVCAKTVDTPDGLALVLDPSIPNVNACQYVLRTGEEASIDSLMSLSPADSAELAMLVVGVWAVGWAFRAMIQASKGDANVEKND